MFKLFAALIALQCFSPPLLGGFTFPRLTHGDADYVLMPFLGYLSVLLLARVLALGEKIRQPE